MRTIAIKFDTLIKEGGIAGALFFLLIELTIVNSKSLYWAMDSEGWIAWIPCVIGSLAFSSASLAVMRKGRFRNFKVILPFFDSALIFIGLNITREGFLIQHPLKLTISIFFAAFTWLIIYILGAINYEENKEIEVSNKEKVKHQTDINELKEENTRLKTDLHKLQTDFTKVKTDFTKSQTDFTKVKTDLAQKQTDFDALKTDLAQKQTDFHKLKTDLAQKQTDYDKLKTDLAQKQTDYDKLKTDLVNIKTDFSKKQTDFIRIKTDLDKSKSEIAILKTDLAKKQSEIDIYKDSYITNELSRIRKKKPENRTDAESAFVNKFETEHSE